jgi:hypothetical protein
VLPRLLALRKKLIESNPDGWAEEQRERAKRAAAVLRAIEKENAARLAK